MYTYIIYPLQTKDMIQYNTMPIQKDKTTVVLNKDDNTEGVGKIIGTLSRDDDAANENGA